MDRRNFLRTCGGIAGSIIGWKGLQATLPRGPSPGPVPGSIRLDDEDWSRIRRQRTDDGGNRAASDTHTQNPSDEKTTTTPDSPTRPRRGSFLVGVSPMNGLSQVSALERWQGGTNATVVIFVTLGLSRSGIRRFVRGPMSAIWSRGSVPHVMWQPYMTSASDPEPDVERRIADGQFDDTLTAWRTELEQWAVADSAAETDRRVYLNFAPEMNGNWTPWDASDQRSTASDYVDMWRHTRRLLMDRSLTSSHVQWVWTVNNTSATDEPIREFYPGDEYVDWVSLHGYNWNNWGGWKTPTDVYERMRTTVRRFSDKPLALSEYGSSSEYDGGHDPDRKDAWIQSAFNYIRDSDIKIACYFNKEKETDWAVFGGDRGTETFKHGGRRYQGYEAYRKGVADPRALTAYPRHPRVVAEAEFKGKF